MSEFNTKYHENIPVMQYSGMDDKNGVEIYEGDIVKYTHYKTEYLEVVKFRKSGFTPLSNFNTSGEFEVIGNIYENADMLD